MTRDEALSTSVSVAISVTQDGEVVSFDRSAFKKNLAKAGFVVVPLEPTEKMLEAARDWSIAKYGKAVGNDGAIGCCRAMIVAYEKEMGDG